MKCFYWAKKLPHNQHYQNSFKTADRLAELVEHRIALREAAGSSLGLTNTQGLFKNN